MESYWEKGFVELNWFPSECIQFRRRSPMRETFSLHSGIPAKAMNTRQSYEMIQRSIQLSVILVKLWVSGFLTNV